MACNVLLHASCVGSEVSMNNPRRVSRTAVAVATACAVLLSPNAPLLGAQAAAPKTTSQTTPAPGTDGGWPRDYETARGTVRVFQPQVGSWDAQKHMVFYAAVSYGVTGASKPSMGTIKAEADTTVSVSERLVNFTNLKLTQSNFPDLPRDQLQEVVARIQEAVPQGSMVLGLDRVLARLDKSQIIPKSVEGVKADPPVIFYSTSPAVLVNLDGDPIWSPIKDNDLKFAVNTNWDLFQHVPPTRC